MSTFRNPLRDAYRAGEVCSNANYRYEGGTRGDVSSTTRPSRPRRPALPPTTPRSCTPPGTPTGRFIYFMLNKRARELLGELHRWEDLARTETLVLRAKALNPDAATIQAFHKLRPIPQTHLERITRNGQLLNAAERQAEQTPGY